MSDTVVFDGDMSLNVYMDGESECVIKVGHEVVTRQLSVDSNGIYNAPVGVDGYTPVVVDVPPPAVQSKSVEPLTTEQIIEPDEGYDYLSSVYIAGYNKPFNVLKYLSRMDGLLKNVTLSQDTLTLDFEGGVVTHAFQAFMGLDGINELIIKNLCYSDGTGVNCQEIFRESKFKTLRFVNCVFLPNSQPYPFYNSKIEVIDGLIDMTYRTSDLTLTSHLKECRFVSSTIHGDFSINNCASLSKESIISIANGLTAGVTATIDIRKSSALTIIQNVVGNVVDGSFVEDETGTTTLESFIVETKGWTTRKS